MRSSDALAASREQVLAFRLDSHHLAARLPPGSLLAAAGACGIQDTPPGSAALALHARVAGLTPAIVEQAIATDKSLLRAWSLRAAPCVFPVGDAAVFTAGLLPENEASARFFILGSNKALDMLGMSAMELIDMTAAATCDLLDGRTMTKDQMGIELADRLAQRLTAGQCILWQSDSFIVPGQSLGESLVRFALYVLPLRGLICFASRSDNKAYLTRIDQWLGALLPAADAAKARGELVRRYLQLLWPVHSGTLLTMGRNLPGTGLACMGAHRGRAHRGRLRRKEDMAAPGGYPTFPVTPARRRRPLPAAPRAAAADARPGDAHPR